MSFASEVKKELLNTDDLSPECKKAMLYGIIINSSEIAFSKNGLKIIVNSSLLNVLKFALPLLRDIYGINVGLSYSEEVGLQNRRFYHIEIIDNVEQIINDFHLMPCDHLSKHDKIIENDTLRSAFVRGCFVAKGSINDPRKNCYHFEISTSRLELAELIQRILKGKKIIASICERRNQYVVYIKKAELISDTLAFIGASSGVFYFGDSRILRDVNNMANRLVNCDIANEVKCMSNCKKQLDAIKFIREHDLFDKMPVRLQCIAILRETYSDASYDELSEYSENVFGKPLTKSGIGHCMRSLMAYYDTVSSKDK